MYYKKELHIWDNYTSKAFEMYFKGCKICVLDIETTGLSPERSHFVLGSLLSLGEEAQLVQYFAESFSEEKKLLEEFIKDASNHDIILTYNGKNFDVPFLLSRADKLETDVTSLPYNLDLYLVLNGHSSLRKLLPNLKQKTVEDFMGLWHYRTDRISGAESAMLYHKYLCLKENCDDTEECMQLMLLHNKDDVLQLGRLLPVLEKADFHKAMYNLGFPVISDSSGGADGGSEPGAPGLTRLFVKNIKLEKSELKVNGTQEGNSAEYISYGDGGSVRFIQFKEKSRTFEISFSLLKKNDLLIIDLLKLPPGICDNFLDFPNFESGYLVFKSQNDIKYREINYFIKTFLLKLLEDIS